MNRRFSILSLCFAWCCLWAGAPPAQAFAIGPALSLEKLTEKCDLVVKATALASTPVADASFEPLQGFAAYNTRFKIVTVLKGEVDGEIDFHHYGETGKGQRMLYWPESYTFKAGRTYLLWAKQSPDGILRQFSPAPASNGQIALLTRDDTPAIGTDVRVIAWNEMNFLLDSDDSTDLLYAIHEIDSRSSVRFGPADFDRDSALNAMIHSYKSADLAVAQAAIEAAGHGGARTVQAELMAVANNTTPHSRPASLRAEALRSLRGVSTPQARQCALDHAKAPHEPSSGVRAAALELLGDYKGNETTKIWTEALRSPDSTVRQAVCNGAARAGDGAMAPALDPLLDDKIPTVRQSAAAALLVLPPAAARAVWKKRLSHPEFWMVFTTALARGDAAPYRADLARIVLTHSRPPGNITPGGQDAVYTAWHLLFEHLRLQPKDFQLDAKTAPLWDALEHDDNWGSSEPEQLYEWYRRIGLEARAQSFRKRTEATKSYMPQCFKRADEQITSGAEWSH